MWIFTKHGFFSVVCARKGNGNLNQPNDLDLIMVRGRLRSHLKALKNCFADLLCDYEIQETTGTHYAFRLFVPKLVWTQVLAGLAEETDYDNFKSEVAHHQGEAGSAYGNSLEGVWSIMHRLQETEGLPTVTLKQIDAILPFLDRFETAGFTSGTWTVPEGQMPWFNLEQSVSEFYQALYDNDWVTPAFDWTEWQQSAEELVESPQRIETIDSATILKLFTTHVRADRFCEGHFGSMFENGHIVALLRRLRELKEIKAKEDTPLNAPNETKVT